MAWIENRFEEGLIVTSIDWAMNWARHANVWPMTFGLACCAVQEAGGARYERDRFGADAFRATPREANLLIVAGTITYKMAPRLKRIYDEMTGERHVMAVGACAIGGGPYYKYGYHVVQGVEHVIPVDVYVAGCPPRPEALLEGLLRLQDKQAARAGGAG